MMKPLTITRAYVAILAALSAAAPAAAQAPESKLPVPGLTFAYIGEEDEVMHLGPHQDQVSLKVEITLAPGWKINSTSPLDEYLVPTSLEIESEGLEFRNPIWPAPEKAFSQAMGGDMATYSGNFSVYHRPERKGGKPLFADKKGKIPQPRTRVTLHYQSCHGNMCYPPKSVTVEH